ncbi:MAG: hypothetical protein MI861_17360, partial [Pirellulales bacterium]|nr:hypothetical protein [Pirellulales bacterium]
PGISIGNVVFGNVEIFDNVSQIGIFVAGNEIGGNLQCGGNGFATPVVVDNIVAGNIECDD